MNPVLTGPQGLPEKSLADEIVRWCSRYIRQPDGPDAGGPWHFTVEQYRFLSWWYAVDPTGRWLYRRGVLRRAKGWGKSPFVAALALVELCGPCRWDKGKPASVPAAWVQLAGVSEKQTVNTMSMVLGMAAESPIVADYGLDLGLTRIFTAAGGRLEPITASASTAEGARPTFVVEDETHWWSESNGGVGLDRVNRRNLAKSRDGAARMLETTNAHIPGENSVAEKSFDAWDGGNGPGILYDSREAPGDVDLNDRDSRLEGLEAARGDSVWVDLERLDDEIMDGSTPPAEARRFYLNQLTHAVDSWITQPEWAGCAHPDRVVGRGEEITIGFDGSRARARGIADATALIGCRVSDGHLFELGVWEQRPGEKDWQVPTVEVDAAVRFACTEYRVVGFYADPAKWESFVAGWEATYSQKLRVRATRDHPMSWWMTGGRSSQVVRALEQFHTAVVTGELSHSGEFNLTRHLLNARRRPKASGMEIGKEHPDSARKIDAAVAAVLAWQARVDVLAKGSKPPGHAPFRIR